MKDEGSGEKKLQGSPRGIFIWTLEKFKLEGEEKKLNGGVKRVLHKFPALMY